MTQLQGMDVAIIGAGVAGLTAACALAQRGAHITVYERAGAMREVGAGLQISPNAGRVLAALGLTPAMEAASLRSHAVELHDHTGRLVARLDMIRHRPEAPFRLIHRARLVELLAEGARAAGTEIRLNTSAEVLSTNPARLSVAGKEISPDLLIGADGLHSVTRKALNGGAIPFFTGQTAWRALIPDDSPAAARAQVFMGPGQHLVSYPIGHGLRNIVAVRERANWQEEGWAHLDDPANLRAAFQNFGGPVPGWLAQVGEVGIWGLFRHPVAPHWHQGNTAILGDAAHPTLPFLAQGAVMAIEDAWILAACLDASPIPAALNRYQALRQPRVTRIVEAANKNARNYHLTGAPAAIAHLGLRAISKIAPGRLLSGFDWLYDYDPVAEVR